MPEAIQQRFQSANIIGASRDVCALVAAELGKGKRVMISEAPGMKLHDQSVIDTHLRHFGQHLRSKELGVLWRWDPTRDPFEKRLRFSL